MNVAQAPDVTADTQLRKPGNYLGTANTWNVVEVPARWSGNEGIW